MLEYISNQTESILEYSLSMNQMLYYAYCVVLNVTIIGLIGQMDNAIVMLL